MRIGALVIDENWIEFYGVRMKRPKTIPKQEWVDFWEKLVEDNT